MSSLSVSVCRLGNIAKRNLGFYPSETVTAVALKQAKLRLTGMDSRSFVAVMYGVFRIAPNETDSQLRKVSVFTYYVFLSRY